MSLLGIPVDKTVVVVPVQFGVVSVDVFCRGTLSEKMMTGALGHTNVP